MPEYSEVARPAQPCTVSVGQMGSSSFPKKFSELSNCSDYARCARYFAAGDSLRSDTPNPGDLWLADHFRGDSFPLASTLSEQLFHRQLLPLAATLVAISLLGED